MNREFVALTIPIFCTIVYIVRNKQIAILDVISSFVSGLNVCNHLRQCRVWCNIAKSVKKNSDFICSWIAGFEHLLCALKILLVRCSHGGMTLEACGWCINPWSDDRGYEFESESDFYF